MSLPLIALTVFIVPLCIFYTFGHFPEPRNPKAILSLILILETGMIGTFVAQDLILFFRILRSSPPANVLHDRSMGRRR